MSGRQLLAELEGTIEVPLDLEHRRAVDQRLCQLAQCHVAAWDENAACHPGPRRVSGCGSTGVPGRRAQNRARTLFDRLGYRESHTAVLEGAGRIQTLALEPHLRLNLFRQSLGEDQRSISLVEGHYRSGIGDREAIEVTPDDAAATGDVDGHVRPPPSRSAHLLRSWELL